MYANLSKKPPIIQTSLAEEFADYMPLLQKYAKYFLQVFLGMDQEYVRIWSKSSLHNFFGDSDVWHFIIETTHI